MMFHIPLCGFTVNRPGVLRIPRHPFDQQLQPPPRQAGAAQVVNQVDAEHAQQVNFERLPVLGDYFEEAEDSPTVNP
jgi:hypothetical protein